MTDSTDRGWPLPAFYFQIKIAGQEAAFKEVSGLDPEAQVIEYRHGNSAEYSRIKIPGFIKHSNITLKKGVFKGDNIFWDWFNNFKMNVIQREEVVISLLDERGIPVMVWKVQNAWPTKITGTDLNADGGEVAVETLELAYEGITINNG